MNISIRFSVPTHDISQVRVVTVEVEVSQDVTLTLTQGQQYFGISEVYSRGAHDQSFMTVL